MILAVLICGLVAYRLARALTLDTISEPIRTWSFDRAYDTDDEEEITQTYQPWSWLHSLLSCPFCASWWIALGTYGLWINARGFRPWIAAAAVAGVASLCFEYRRPE